MSHLLDTLQAMSKPSLRTPHLDAERPRVQPPAPTISNGLDLFLLPHEAALPSTTGAWSAPTMPMPPGILPTARKRVRHWLINGGIVMLFGLLMAGLYVYHFFQDDTPPLARHLASTRQSPAPLVQEQPSPPIISPWPVVQSPPPVKPAVQKTRPAPRIPVLQPPREQDQATQASLIQEPSASSSQYLFLTTRPNPWHQARQAFLQGRLSAAKKQFKNLLAQDAHNLHAMTGLAATAIQEHQPDQARRLYQEILNLDPNHTLALAAVLPDSDPATRSARLQHLLHDAPQSAPLHFALGVVHAEQKAWTAAQAEFERAHQLDNSHPDILFNLAVTLDQQGQQEAAARHYRAAMQNGSVRGGAGFDTHAVQRRLNRLEQTGNAP